MLLAGPAQAYIIDLDHGDGDGDDCERGLDGGCCCRLRGC
jgi:hypothetical protein